MSNLHSAANRSKDQANLSVNNFQIEGFNNKFKDTINTNFKPNYQNKQLTSQNLQANSQFNHLGNKVSNSFNRQVSDQILFRVGYSLSSIVMITNSIFF